MADEFLLKEYDACFEQLRFYDRRQAELLRNLLTLSSASILAMVAIYKIEKVFNSEFLLIFSLSSIVVTVCCVLIYLSMLQNRVYFVYVARQINAIRGFFLENESNNFNANQMYTGTNFSAAKPMSIHTMMLAGASFFTALFAGIALLGFSWIDGSPNWVVAVALTIVIFLAATVGGYNYLNNQTLKSADNAVHGSDD